jgi:predicted metal-binding membrane protein
MNARQHHPPRPTSLLAVAAALCWALTVWIILNMDHPLARLTMPMSAAWKVETAVAVWLMWSVMMAAMMLPSTAPMVSVHRMISLRSNTSDHSPQFIAGYVVIWAAFSLIATVFQWAFQTLNVTSHMLVITQDWIAGTILILAGLTQWTPLKDRCLSQCRTPAGFFMTHWRAGRRGAFRMGLLHGSYCLGCCWALMALLFVFGVMNLTAILILSLLAATEKLLPSGQRIGQIIGIVLLVWGAITILA